MVRISNMTTSLARSGRRPAPGAIETGVMGFATSIATHVPASGNAPYRRDRQRTRAPAVRRQHTAGPFRTVGRPPARATIRTTVPIPASRHSGVAHALASGVLGVLVD